MSANPTTLNSAGPGRDGASAPQLYLDLLARVLTRTIDMETLVPARTPVRRRNRAAFRAVSKLLAKRGIVLARETNLEDRTKGWDWPRRGETMVGLGRLENVRRCVTDVVCTGVPGDLLEAGVWRGGVAIYMRAVLGAYGDTTRKVWLADSFQGLPKPDAERYPADAGDVHHVWDELAVSVDEVRHNFERYGLLDDQVQFLEGWFHETLPTAPVERLAVLRLDGDMYESTIVSLEALYDRVSPGGYVIVDDYGSHPQCAAAVDEFRAARGITEPLEAADWTGVYWQRCAR